MTPVTGRFDLVIRLNTNSPNKAFSTVERIRGLRGITSTQTAISFQQVSTSRHETGTETETPAGFTLVKVRGKVQNILRRLRSLPNFLEAHAIPGEFDVLATFRGYGPEEVAETTVERLNNIPSVASSETLVTYTPTNTNSTQF